MGRIWQTPRSRADVRAIGRFIRRDDPIAARRVLMAVDRTFKILSDFPMLGRARDELQTGLRSIPVSPYPNYIVFFVPLPDGIQVVRVLHGARNLPTDFPQR